MDISLVPSKWNVDRSHVLPAGFRACYHLLVAFCSTFNLTHNKLPKLCCNADHRGIYTFPDAFLNNLACLSVSPSRIRSLISNSYTSTVSVLSKQPNRDTSASVRFQSAAALATAISPQTTAFNRSRFFSDPPGLPAEAVARIANIPIADKTRLDRSLERERWTGKNDGQGKSQEFQETSLSLGIADSRHVRFLAIDSHCVDR